MAIKNQEIRLIKFFKDLGAHPELAQTETGATFAFYNYGTFDGYKWKDEAWRKWYFENQPHIASKYWQVNEPAKEWTNNDNEPLLIGGYHSQYLEIIASSKKIIKSIFYNYLNVNIDSDDIMARYDENGNAIFKYVYKVREYPEHDSEGTADFRRWEMRRIRNLKFKEVRLELALYYEIAD